MLSLLIKTGNEVKKIMTTYPLMFITSLQIDLRKLLLIVWQLIAKNSSHDAQPRIN